MSNPKRVFNFNPGPAVLPLEVLEQAQAELLDFKGTGMSVMEISHRSKEFEAVIQTAEADLRELLGIPANYKIMFLQGGASLQFAMLPMNLRAAGAQSPEECAARFFEVFGTGPRGYASDHIEVNFAANAHLPRAEVVAAMGEHMQASFG